MSPLGLARVISRLNSLDDEMQHLTERFVILAADQGIPIRITQARRTNQEQQALYAQGRLNRSQVNVHRKDAGLPPLGRFERNRIVTNAKPGRSPHNFGLAFDIVPMALSHRLLPAWSSPHWRRLGEIGEALGLSWGGRWKKPDRPHFELPTWKQVSKGGLE